MKMLRMTVTKMRAVAALLSMFRRGCFAMSFRFKRAVQHNAESEGGLQTGSKCPSSCRPPLPGKCSCCPSVLGPQSRESSHRNATGKVVVYVTGEGRRHRFPKASSPLFPIKTPVGYSGKCSILQVFSTGNLLGTEIQQLQCEMEHWASTSRPMLVLMYCL